MLVFRIEREQLDDIESEIFVTFYTPSVDTCSLANFLVLVVTICFLLLQKLREKASASLEKRTRSLYYSVEGMGPLEKHIRSLHSNDVRFGRTKRYSVEVTGFF